MSMVDLMWLFCGAFIGGLITLFFMAMVNASHEAEALEQAQRKIQALEEDKRALKMALESPTSPDKGDYTDTVKLLGKDGKAIKTGRTGKRACAICGHEYGKEQNQCPVCGCPAYVGLTKPEDLVDKIMEVCDDGSTAL